MILITANMVRLTASLVNRICFRIWKNLCLSLESFGNRLLFLESTVMD
jgi:hypothetical protein